MDNASTLSSAGSDVFAVAPAREQAQAGAFDAILEQSRNLICEYLDEAVAAMLDKADETLFERMTETHDREENRILEEARQIVARERDVIEAGFRMRYLTEFKQRSNRARKIGTTFETTEIALESLELVAQDDLDETLKFNDMASKLRAYCDDELTALDQRVGVLLGDATLQANDNPFSPQVICDAYKNACRQLDAELSVRRVLLKLFDDHVLDAIRAVYKDVNTLLVQNSILPKIRYGIARGEERKTGSAPATAAESADKLVEAPAVDMSTVAAQDLFSILQRLATANAAAGSRAAGGGAGGAQMETGAGGSAAVPVMQGAALLGSLTRIQRGDLSAIVSGTLNACAGDPGTINVLRELKATSVGAGMGQVDLLTLDIIAMLFDQLFDDPKVPNGVKGLIGRLQIPMLKVAIADKSFFSTKAHPARKLLDAVGELASRLPSDFSTAHPLFERLQNLLQELVDGYHDDLAIFAKACEQLSALMAEEDRRIEEAARTQARRVEEMEKLALAKSVAQDEIKKRFDTHVLPLPIIDFLTRQWLRLLLLVHAKEGKDGASWKGALQLMDQLIWSIAPKQTPEERAKLGTVMPKLIKNLTNGMKFIGTEDAVRERFFVELMKCHTQAMGAAPQAPAPAQANAQGAVDAHSERKALGAGVRQALERSLDFSRSVIVKNPYGSGDVSVESQDLDFTEAETASRARARREESIRRALDTLGMGAWVEFREPDDPSVRRPARLIFVSPHKSRYLFAVGKAGKEIIQCSRAEIGRRLRIGEAVKLDKPPEESLFDRIMGTLLGKLRGPMHLPLPAA